jgi:hypothetical protein
MRREGEAVELWNRRKGASRPEEEGRSAGWRRGTEEGVGVEDERREDEGTPAGGTLLWAETPPPAPSAAAPSLALPLPSLAGVD